VRHSSAIRAPACRTVGPGFESGPGTFIEHYRGGKQSGLCTIVLTQKNNKKKQKKTPPPKKKKFEINFML